MNPKNIHCLALNYRGVGDERAMAPLYFVKSANTYAQNGVEVEVPRDVSRVWTEVELAFIVSKSARNISCENARDYIYGFAVAADISCENINKRDHHLAFSKSRKGFCPVGEMINASEVDDLTALSMVTEINGKITQEGCTSGMIMNPYQALEYLSAVTQLEEGDLVITGTPPGHEYNTISPGDQICHRIDTIGELSYSIV